jgi:hypothetical protein
MNSFILKILLIVSVIVPSTCKQEVLTKYQVKKINETISISGKGIDPIWKQANLHENFTYPWRSETPPPTQFKSLYNDDYFYFLYRANDDYVHLDKSGRGEMDAVDSDRVEIFFKADDKMNPYYALEMDALGRILDTKGVYHRKIDFDWNWPAGHLIVKASIDDNGYFVEGAISFESLRSLGLYKDDFILKAGLYRGEYIKNHKGEIDTKWISWIKPDSETPDFHIPSSFGILELEH